MSKSEPPHFQSPPIARAVAVLDFLAGHPEQAFTLTEIAKSLKISSATCHNLVTALSDAGYLFRTIGKTYVLGPALARVAQASLAPAVLMQVTRPEMRQLADEFDVVCSAFYLKDGESIIRERAAALSHVTWNAPYLVTTHTSTLIGRFLSTWDERVFEAWRAEIRPDDDRAERARAAMLFLRDEHFTFGVRKVPLTNPDQARLMQNQPDLTETEVGELDRERMYELAYVVAPVFSRPGAFALGLSLAGFTEPVRGDSIAAMGARLREAAERIGAFIGGRKLD